MEALNQTASLIPEFSFSGKIILFIAIIIVCAGLAFTVKGKKEDGDDKD